MKMYTKRKITLTDVAFAFILCMALLHGYCASRFAWSGPLWNIGIIASFAAIILDNPKKFDRKSFNTLLIGGLIFIVLLGINYVCGENNGYAGNNLMKIARFIVIQMSIVMLATNPRAEFFSRLKKCFRLFNVWGILNMIVLTIQINVKGFMMPPVWLSMNSYYEDLCAGLFGYNGTHRLGIYMTFLFFYNLYIGEFEIKKPGKKRMLNLYNLGLLVWHFLLSTRNDNMNLYIMTAVFLVAYVFLDLHWRGFSLSATMAKWLKYIVLIAVLIVLLLLIPTTNDFITGAIARRITVLSTVTSDSNISGSTERLGIILYSLENENGFGLGKGIGYYPFSGDSEDMETNASSTGFRHFGLSSMSSMIYLMGVWFYLFFIIWIVMIYRCMCKGSDKTFSFTILFLMLYMTFYSTVLTAVPQGTNLMLLITVFCMMEESIRNNKRHSLKKNME